MISGVKGEANLPSKHGRVNILTIIEIKNVYNILARLFSFLKSLCEKPKGGAFRDVSTAITVSKQVIQLVASKEVPLGSVL